MFYLLILFFYEKFIFKKLRMSIAVNSSFHRLLTDRLPACLGVIQLRHSRRRVAPPPWVPPMYHPLRTKLYKADREYVEQRLGSDPKWQAQRALPVIKPHSEQTFHLIPGIPNPPDCTQNQYNIDTSKRIGLIGRKIGMTLQWMKDGTRCLCTLIHVPDNHVLSANDPETWYRHSIAGKQKAFLGSIVKNPVPPMWSQMVGAQDYDSVFLTDEYRRLFVRAGVTCKKFMAGFVVTGDAVVQPGTQLDVRHFQVGQWITISGKSIDWGFQGVMHRWGMRGQMNKECGPTKAHRRVGSIGGKGEAKVWAGRRLPGHMGWEWRHMVGVKVLRINPIKQIIYIKGCVPGDLGEWVLLKDCFVRKWQTGEREKRAIDPPFPTFYAPAEAEREQQKEQKELQKIYSISSQDIYDPKLHKMSDPTIVYTDADEIKSTRRDKSRAKTARIKK